MSVEELKELVAKHERTLRLLRAENLNLKKMLKERSYEGLMKQIENLKAMLREKEKIIADLQKLSGKNDEATIKELKSRIIILQSKLRKANSERDKLKDELEELKIQNARLKRQSSEVERLKSLEAEVQRYKKMIAGYKAQLSEIAVYKERIRELEEENGMLRKKVEKLSATASRPSGAHASEFDDFAGDTATVEKLRKIIAEKDMMIEDLKRQLSEMPTTGGGGGFFGSMRNDRRIAELQAQLKMYKKIEADLRRRLEEAERKLAQKDFFDEF